MLEGIIDKLNKKYGLGTVFRATDKPIDVPRQTTGVVALDWAIGGGLPLGRMVEIYGDYAAAKTTLALYASKGTQAEGLCVGYVDAEGTFDREWAKNIGVDLDRLVLAQPEDIRVGGDIMDEMVRDPDIGLVVLDSVPALVPTEEIDESMEKDQIGIQPRLMNKIVRRCASALNRASKEKQTAPIIIFINQVRAAIGVYGTPFSTPGGMGLKFHASIRIELRKGEVYENSAKQKVSQQIKFKVVKNKTAPPFQTGYFHLYFRNAEGFNVGEIDNVEGAIVVGIDKGLIKVSGAWYYYGKYKCQGYDKFWELVKNDKKVFEQLIGDIYE